MNVSPMTHTAPSCWPHVLGHTGEEPSDAVAPLPWTAGSPGRPGGGTPSSCVPGGHGGLAPEWL